MNSKLQNDIMKIWDEIGKLEKENRILKDENEALKIRSGIIPKNKWSIERRRIDPCCTHDCIIKNDNIWCELERNDFGSIYNSEGIINSLLKELNK